jgi:hypothetical protein
MEGYKYLTDAFPVELFESKLDKTGEHWLWTGYVREDGYGHFNWYRLNGSSRGHQVHQLACELYFGPLTEGIEVGHLCEFKHCVRHIEPMTHSENQHQRSVSRRSRGLPPIKQDTFKESEQTHCKHNHEFTKENTYRSPRGHRECKVCRRDAVRRSKGKEVMS